MSSEELIRVAIVDDHAVVREGLGLVIESAGDMVPLVSVPTGAELLARLADTAVDVCLMDLSLPDGDGLELLGRIREVRPEVAVLVLTAHSAAAFGVPALNAGADGFLTKAATPAEIVRAVRALSKGLVHVPPELAAIMVRRGQDGPPPHTRLSQRELTVFLRLAQGRSNREIAAELHLNQRTVTTYRRRVLDKLGVSTNADLVRYAVDQGLIGVPPAMG